MAKGRDPQWVPDQTLYNDVRFRIGAFVVPPSIWLSKCGFRCQSDVVDQMKLPTTLAFAIATQIHVSHSPAIIRALISSATYRLESWGGAGSGFDTSTTVGKELTLLGDLAPLRRHAILSASCE
jgi:hypothetical protein